MDWGFSKNIQILTLGRVNPEEIYGFGKQSTDVFVGEVRKYLANPDNVYLFHSAEKAVFPRQEAFLAEAARMGKTVTVDKVFYQQDGVLVYLLSVGALRRVGPRVATSVLRLGADPGEGWGRRQIAQVVTDGPSRQVVAIRSFSEASASHIEPAAARCSFVC